MTTTYPITLILDGRPCVVVGAGAVAERKVEALLEAGGRVRVVAPALVAGLEARLERGEIEVARRAYRGGDLAGAFLVIAAADDAQVNREVWAEARERELLINTVDDPSRCTFYVPGVVRRGRLTLAISTTGACCAFTRRIRQDLERRYPEEYATLLDLFAELRPMVSERFPDDFKLRKEIWYRLVDAGLLELIVAAGVDAARERALEVVEERASVPG